MLAISYLSLASHFGSCSVTLMSPQNHFQRVFNLIKKKMSFFYF